MVAVTPLFEWVVLCDLPVVDALYRKCPSYCSFCKCPSYFAILVTFHFRSTTMAMYQWGLDSLVALLHDPFHAVVPSSLLTGLMLMQQWGQAALTTVRPPLPHSWPWLKAWLTQPTAPISIQEESWLLPGIAWDTTVTTKIRYVPCLIIAFSVMPSLS